MKHLPRSSPHLVHDETKSFGSIPSTPVPHPLDAVAKKIKMPIYARSTILKLENSRKMLEIVFCVYTEHAKFQKASLIATEM